MIYDSDSDPHLKLWLVKNLEPICDAEPGALGDYILALLKHPASEPELRKELIAQLEEFLEKETINFIDLLFNALRSKSFLPYTNSPPPPAAPSAHAPRAHPNEERPSNSDSGIPIPLDAVMSQQPPSSRKRSLEHANDEREYRKGPRLSNDSQVPRYGNGARQWSGPNRGGGRGRDSSSFGGDAGVTHGINGMNVVGPYEGGRSQQQQQQQYRPPDQVKKGICRDYHNHGYCSRGAYCKFSHGEDAVVPSQLLPMATIPNGMMPFMSMMNNAMFGGVNGAMGNNGAVGPSGGAYDPHERMDMRPRGGMMRTPMIHRQDGSISSSGELPVIQDLTPRIPLEEQRHDQFQNGSAQIGRNDDSVQGYSTSPAMDVDTDAVPQPRHHNHHKPQNNYNHHTNGGYRGGSRRGSRMPQAPGTFPVDDFPQTDIPSTSSSPFPTSVPRPERRNDKTLVVEKIPEEHLSLGAVNDWFKRFGTVTNVAVDVQSAKALVSFSEHDDALKAWKTEDAVFGNRFVKVFWHRPMSGHGSVGNRMLKASAPLVSRLAAQGEPNNPAESTVAAPGLTTASATEPISGVTAPPTPSAKTANSNTVSALAAKQQLLKQQIVEQKNLMAKLDSASPSEKKEILGRLRKLGEEMKSSTTAPLPSSVSPTPTRRAPSTPSMGRSEDQERMERERLDKELELHAATTGADGEVEESTEDLKAKLAKLQAEAASLGLPEADSSYPAYSGGNYHRSYRGRGRGSTRGGYYRGRGGPRTSMKLDNRPKRLLMKGVDAESVQTVKDWYGTTGSVESVESIEGGDLVVSFRTRAAAEQGFAKGSTVPTVGQVQVSWYNEQPTTSRQQSQQPQISPNAVKQDVGESGGRTDHNSVSAHHNPHGVQEEELVASGWGDDGEDGIGLL